jgi:hypothetical protein
VAVGSNGDTLVADSAASTGLRWQGNYAAGKNKFINADFLINQRGFTSSTSSNIFPADRWKSFNSGGTVTTSRENFTPGAAPVAGYEGRTFLRTDVTGQSTSTNYSQVRQYIEDVTNFAGETVTLSFWAKAASGTPDIAANFVQNFGTGGSPSTAAFATTAQKVTISSSWARYSMTFAIASISGKTLGTNVNTSSLELRLYLSAGTAFDAESDTLGIQTNTFDLWGFQIEAGNVSTSFQTATGTLQGEFAAACYYYQKGTFDVRVLSSGASANYAFPQKITPMRVSPTPAFTAAASATNNISGTPTITMTDAVTLRQAFVASATATDTYYVRAYELSAEL